MLDKSTSIEAFLSAAAAKQPTPGGGSIAALAGALAASMGEMVLQYSVGKKGLEAHQDQLAAALGEFTRARQMLLELMVEDQAAYETLSAARKSDPQLLAAMSVLCCKVPQFIAASAVAILDLCDELADKVNPRLLSDLAVCGELSMATIRCAACNIRVNLADITDQKARGDLEADCQRFLSHGVTVMQRLMPKIAAIQRR
ncbi:MAG TPA: cyclodeaminase/cyclohydrolase family protein [Tepidisphaeraceae bacterium]|nr:cyclodeaminase/cyclohydrolase family protein [Tepidisphaeraceae bacterium]